MAKPSKVSKFFKTLLSVLLIIIILVTVAINVAFLKTSNAPELFGTSIYVMQQDNMNDVHLGDAVISSSKELENLKVGNTVLCLTSPANDFKEVLKLINIAQEDGSTYYYVRADQESDADALKLTQDKIIAKCLWTNSTLGTFINFAKNTIGIVVLVLVPCAILLIMKITSDISERAEEKKEEELRKATEEETTKSNKNRHKSNDSSNTQRTANHKKRKDITLDNIEVPTKNANKKIPVKTLSEEESIKQRENISNMVGSELEKNKSSDAKTRAFDSNDITVSSMKNVDAVKIYEEEIPVEEVHSPNMLEKANKIKQNLSNAYKQDEEIASTSTVEKPSIVEEPKPQDTSVKEEPSTPKVEPQTTTEVPNLDDAVVIIPTTEDTSKEKDVTTEKPSVEETSKDVETPIEKTSLAEDDFLNDLINDDFTTTKSNSSRVSNDILDELLDSIPSTHKTEQPKKSAPQTSYKPKKPKTKPVHHVSKSIKTPKVTNKMVDNTSFDELIKAIEKEKNSMK